MSVRKQLNEIKQNTLVGNPEPSLSALRSELHLETDASSAYVPRLV